MTGADALLIPPCGGALVDLAAPAEAREALRARAGALPSVQISARAACDLELLATGGFSPLDRFMGRADLARVCAEMRLAGGHLFPIPVTLPVAADAPVALDREVALRDAANRLLAVLRVDEIYPWPVERVAREVLGTTDLRHPLVSEMHGWGPLNVSGPLTVIELPAHRDFRALRLAPAATRARLAGLGRRHVVALQTRELSHRGHEELARRAAAALDGALLLQLAVGLGRPGDVDHYARVRAGQAVVEHCHAPDRAVLALLPLATRMAGPREALWHALIQRNHGASHLIVERAPHGSCADGTPVHGPDDARELVERHAPELGVAVVPCREIVYLPDEHRYEEVERVRPGTRTAALSGAAMRREYLERGRPIPAWLARPEVAAILAEAHPPRHRQGVCVWFTGLPGAGKSTTAEVLTALLVEHGRQVTLLDGDVVRTHLSRGLGFSKEDRDANVLRIGFVAAEIARHGGAAVCAAVSPYRATRDQVRALVGADRFVEVFVDTPLAVCEARDAKGLYARARRGELAGFTGVDDPYEPPERPELVLDTVAASAEDNARRLVAYLREAGFLVSPSGTPAPPA